MVSWHVVFVFRIVGLNPLPRVPRFGGPNRDADADGGGSSSSSNHSNNDHTDDNMSKVIE